MAFALKDRAAVEKTVAALQEKLADGDPADEDLRRECESVLTGLRAAYRADAALFSRETVDALRELSDLLRDAV